jgi:L-erythro-3,5-diaminohexanoate dehydrogenase
MRSRQGGRLTRDSSVGLHRVLELHRGGVLPQARWRLDNRPGIGPDEVRIDVERLNLDAASASGSCRQAHRRG